MSQINRVPRGLQSLLQSKNFGVNPSELSEVTVPMVDIGSFLKANLWRVTTASIAVPTLGTQLRIAVPEGKVWEIWRVHVRFLNNFAAGGRVKAAIEMLALDPVTGLTVVIPFFQTRAPTLLDVASTGEAYGDGITFDKGMMLPAGNAIQSRSNALDLNAGVSILMALNLVFREYDI